MRFETNDLLSTLDNFGLDLNSLIGIQNYNRPQREQKPSKYVPANEGFLRGNLYKDEYKPYKNMTYFKLEPKSEKEMSLYKVMELSFALTDLNYHLDLHPNDKESLNLFELYAVEYDKEKKEYERKFGPLCVTDTKGEVFDWIDNPWPWDTEKGDMYV